MNTYLYKNNIYINVIGTTPFAIFCERSVVTWISLLRGSKFDHILGIVCFFFELSLFSEYDHRDSECAELVVMFGYTPTVLRARHCH